MYYIYHIPGVKIGCCQHIKNRMRQQKFSNYEIIEEHYDIAEASSREIQLQKQYGYKVDRIPYSESLRRITKAQEISLKTKDKWLPKVDWKARDEKVDYIARAEKIKQHPNYINRRIANGSEQLKKIILQYNLDGNFIKEWTCGVRNMPEKYTNAGGCAKTNNGTLYGYQWRYKTSENYSKQIGKFKSKRYQKVIQKDLKGNIIKIWDSQQQAADTLGCSIQLISRVCRGIGKTAKGFIWERYA
jgi:hypothetical protein